MSEADLIERLLHPVYVEPSAANGGWILDPKTVRADMAAAAEELRKLRAEKNRFGGGGASVSIGGRGGGSSSDFPGGPGGGGAKTASGGGIGGGGSVGPEGLELSNVRIGDAYGVQAPRTDLVEHSDGDINYAVIAACKDNSSHLNHGAVSTWADLIRALARQLDKWIDQDGYNVRIISITATRELIYQKRSGPV